MDRVWKAVTTIVHLFIVYLTVHWFLSGFTFGFAGCCLILSASWLAVTRAKMNQLFMTHFDVTSRLQILLPLGLGVLSALVSFAASKALTLRVLALVLLGYWAYIFSRYRHNQQQFIIHGHGPLPAGTMINPPAAMMQPGWVILTSGCVATKTHQSVGHTELVVRLDGELVVVSSWMDLGMVIHPLERIAKPSTKNHYIALEPVVPWTEEEIRHVEILVKSMLSSNKDYIARTQALRDRIIAALPVSAELKAKLLAKFPITGYDWSGLYTGRRASNRWTCIGLYMEVIWRMGREMNWLGTGMLGLGTGLLDPLKADRLISEPTLRLIKVEGFVEAPPVSYSSYLVAHLKRLMPFKK